MPTRRCPGLSAYAATKAAVLSLTTSLASELRRDKIRVHAVCPDGVDTAMVEAMDAQGDVRAALAAGVLLTPPQVARELVDMFGTGRVYKTLPAWRGVVARTASLAPRAALHVDPWMRKARRPPAQEGRQALTAYWALLVTPLRC